RLGATEIASAAATVKCRVAVEQLAPVSGVRHTHPVVLTHERREVADDEELLALAGVGIGRGTAHVGEHTVPRVVGIEPLEAASGEVELARRALAAVERVEIPHPALHACVCIMPEQRPVELSVVIPFLPLPDLASHEQELLAGLREHVTEEQAE